VGRGILEARWVSCGNSNETNTEVSLGHQASLSLVSPAYGKNNSALRQFAPQNLVVRSRLSYFHNLLDLLLQGYLPTNEKSIELKAVLEWHCYFSTRTYAYMRASSMKDVDVGLVPW